MRLPDFLIIGAMKAGTTTLYGDLMTNSQVFMPDDKEPHCLVREDVLGRRGQRYYAGLFKAARSDQICGEASTGYTKASRFPGVVLRAKQVLRHDLKLIYLVREPVARAISHHHNEIHNPTVPADINEAIRVHAPLIEFGMYTMQLKPWLETFGREQLHIVQFEHFIKHRKETVAAVSQFLGIEPWIDRIDEHRVYNKTEMKPVSTGLWKRIQSSSLYRRRLRKFTTPGMRDLIKRRFLSRLPHRPDPPTSESVDYIIQRVRQDAEELRQIMVRSEPLWDFSEVRRSFLDSPDNKIAAGGQIAHANAFG